MHSKIILALALIIGFNFLNILTVKADSAQFYEAEYVDGVYIRYKGGDTTYYQKARFFRRRSDNMHAYCLEPFVKINEAVTYEGQINPSTISSAKWKRITQIAHFGYNYKAHTTPKWYAVTQYMIWKELEPSANFEFTDTLNGNTIKPYLGEINEINNYIKAYYTKPSFNGSSIDIVEGEKVELTDTNGVLKDYKTNTKSATISGNKLTISDLKEGKYTISLTRNDTTSNNPPLFYYNASSQKLMTAGYEETITSNLTINVIKTNLTINKIDHDTKNTTPSGEGILKGTTYELYDSEMNLIDTLEIDENCTISYDNLVFGKYYLKEKEAGTGYKLDPNTYDFTIDKENNNITLTLENEIIKKKVTINKNYGSTNNFKSEGKATFAIYDSNNKLIRTITTDEEGKAELILSYGTYTFKQTSTKDGYHKVKDFKVVISDKDTDKLEFDLFDYEIQVPDTESTNNYFLHLILLLFLLMLIANLYVEKLN